MNFEQMYERFVLCVLIGFLLVFAMCTGLGTRDARSLLAVYSFFVMGVYLFRGWYFKKPYDKVEIIGCLLIGIVLKSLNHLAP